MWVEYYSIEKGGLTVFFHPWLGVIFSITGIYLVIRAFRSGDAEEHSGCALTFLIAWALGAVLWTVGVYVDIYSKYTPLSSALRENRYQEVEGIVAELRSWQTRQGETESFTVNGVTFQYCYGGVNPGFNQPQSYGGPIAKGRKVKIYYYEGAILKLWLWEDQ